MGLEVLEGHDVSPSSVATLPWGVAQEHLVLVSIDEVSQDLIPETPLLLYVHLLSRSHLSRQIRLHDSSPSHTGFGPLLPLLQTFLLSGRLLLFLLLLQLFLLLECNILDLVHLLLDLVHAQTLLERVGLGGKGVELVLQLLDVALRVTLLEQFYQPLHGLLEGHILHELVAVSLAVLRVLVRERIQSRPWQHRFLLVGLVLLGARVPFKDHDGQRLKVFNVFLAVTNNIVCQEGIHVMKLGFLYL